MQQQKVIKIKDDIPKTHFFLYKNKKYPFNFDFFKYTSKYFQTNELEIKNTTLIPLIDDISEQEQNLTDETIQHFINFVHHQAIPINNDNVVHLNYLSKIYQIEELKDATTDYIKEHQREILIDILIFHQNERSFPTQSYEDILTEHFIEYIDDDRLLSLKMPIIDRVISNHIRFYLSNESKNKIIDFLFKMLDKFGKEASFLFQNVNIGDFKAEYIDRLQREYSDTFDFHFINSELLKSIYESQSQLIVKEMEKEKREAEKDKINEQKISDILKSIGEMKKEQNERIEKLENQNQVYRNEIEELKKDIKKREEENQKLKTIQNQMYEELKKMQINQDILSEIGNVKAIKYLKGIVFSIFEDRNNYKLFNRLSGEQQKFIFNEMKIKYPNNENIDKINNILNYLSNEYQKSVSKNNTSNYIFIPNKEQFNNMPNIDNNNDKIGIGAQIIESLYENGNISSDEFINKLKCFEDIFIELKYPSANISSIYKNIFNIKNSILTQNSVQIGLVLTGAKQVKIKITNSHDISYIKIDSCIEEVSSNKDGGSFNGCSLLRHIFFNSNSKIDKIAVNCFKGCKNIKQISIPQFVKVIEKCSFSECSLLTQIIIPSSVTSIKDSAFSDCTSLKQISIPSSITSIGKNVFSNCSSLEKISIPSSVESISSYTFSGCSSLNQITIPSSVKSIGMHAFEKCLSLKQIEIPYSVTSIGSYTFYECSSLKQISIPNSVTSIDEYCFAKCSSLVEISFDFFSSLQSIKNGAFYGCSLLAKISIPSSVKLIGNSSFVECSLLTKISIPSSVTEIGSYAFCNCISLEEVNIFSSAEISDNLFNGCRELKKITISSSIKTIGRYSFRSCEKLQQITIPSSVKDILKCSFWQCYSLLSITIPSSVTFIEDYAFSRCNSLKEVTIKSSDVKFGYKIFNLCSSLKQVIAPHSLNLDDLDLSSSVIIQRYRLF